MRRYLSSLRFVFATFAMAALAGALVSCSTYFAVTDQQRRADEMAIVTGTVDTDYGASGPLIVFLVARDENGVHVVDYFVSSKSGPWVFAVSPGTYWIAAYEDANDDGRYDAEPAMTIHWDESLQLESGESEGDLAVLIPKDGRFDLPGFNLREVARWGQHMQERVSLLALSAAGEVTTLDDPRFSREHVSEGMWKFYDFLLENRPGIYFLEEYDPSKIPVLFVHGIGGSPSDFASLIGSLDRGRFQPWVFFYPSGARLEGVSALLTQLFTRLRQTYAMPRAVVVAHSMGGLVTRDFLLTDFERSAKTGVAVYVTISSPFGGMASAGHGVKMSPIVVNAWRGLAPGSEFLESLFYVDPTEKSIRRRLPDHMTYHMLFGFHGDKGDGVVALASQLRTEAQDEAASIRGLDETHGGILKSPDTSVRLNSILRGL